MTTEGRAVLAAVLSVIVLMIYLWVQEQYFTPPRPPEAEAPPSAPAPAKAEKLEGAAPVKEAARAAPAAPPAPAPLTPRPPQRTAAVLTPLYEAVVSSDGGKLQEWTLKYRGEKPMVVVGDVGPAGLLVGADERLTTTEPVPMHLGTERLVLDGDKRRGELVLTGEAGGLTVRQTLHFSADTYTIDAVVRLENRGGEARAVTVAFPWFVRRQDPVPEEKFSGQWPTEVVWSAGGAIQRFDDLSAFPELPPTEGAWIGMGSTWYLAAFVPQTPEFRVAVASARAGGEATRADGRILAAARATPTIAPGQAWEGHVVIYVGPKEYDRLARYGLEGTLNFGGFPIPRRWGGLPMEWLGVPILKLMNWVYGYVGNYGVAIIVLTVLSKVLFYPLTVKSLKSMKAMQALQPQINTLKGRYKNDARKLQEETLALYRRHKVNPMGGCLPMIAQIPIFYALYLALSVSVELQNAPFLCFGRLFGVELWICDLASYDPTYVLPVLMGVSMFVQQKMAPTPGDPRQAKMMLLMPFVFTFMFLSLPSGLVLYWSVSNVLQILQQWFMDRTGSRGAAREAKNAARA